MNLHAPDLPVVYIVDDDPAVRDALGLLLRSVGIATRCFADPDAFLAQYDARPGCLLLDIRMPHVSGLAFHEKLVGQGIAIGVIFITGHGDVMQCRRAFKAGAADFLMKPIDETVLIESVQKAIAASLARHGEARLRADFGARLATLTGREREVMHMLMDGVTNKEAAYALDISLRTVESHRARIFEKLAVASLADCVRQYLQVGQAGRESEAST
jgi:two-component system response regulator FixJ